MTDKGDNSNKKGTRTAIDINKIKREGTRTAIDINKIKKEGTRTAIKINTQPKAKSTNTKSIIILIAVALISSLSGIVYYKYTNRTVVAAKKQSPLKTVTAEDPIKKNTNAETPKKKGLQIAMFYSFNDQLQRIKFLKKEYEDFFNEKGMPIDVIPVNYNEPKALEPANTMPFQIKRFILSLDENTEKPLFNSIMINEKCQIKQRLFVASKSEIKDLKELSDKKIILADSISIDYAMYSFLANQKLGDNIKIYSINKPILAFRLVENGYADAVIVNFMFGHEKAESQNKYMEKYKDNFKNLFTEIVAVSDINPCQGLFASSKLEADQIDKFIQIHEDYEKSKISPNGFLTEFHKIKPSDITSKADKLDWSQIKLLKEKVKSLDHFEDIQPLE